MAAHSSVRSRVRALFLDIDGTLVGAANTPSACVRDAVDAARAQGCEVILCTGRTRFTAQAIAEALGSPGYLIASNGGVVMHLGTGEVLSRHLLTIPTALEIARAIVALGSEPYVYEDATEPGIERSRVLYHPDLPTGPFAIAPRYRPHAALLEDLPFAPISVNAYGAPEKMRPLVDRLRARLPADVGLIQSGSASAWGVEAFPAHVNKALGLQVIAARLGLAREEVMAVGDHINDLEMIAWAGIGVAMGNALPEIRAAADWVTASLEEDGVARAIERFVLNSPSPTAWERG